MANGTSSRQKLIHGAEPEIARRFFEFGRHRAQGLIEAERHVPGLAGENREDRGEFGAQHAPGRERHEEYDGDRDEAEDRHRLQNIEQRNEQPFGGFAFGGEGRVGEGEDQRQHHGDEHAQRGARGIFGQVARIERRRLLLQLGQGSNRWRLASPRNTRRPRIKKYGEDIPSAEQAGPAPDRNWDDHSHVFGPVIRRNRVVTKLSWNSRPRRGRISRAWTTSCRDPITSAAQRSNLIASRCFLTGSWKADIRTAGRRSRPLVSK